MSDTKLIAVKFLKQWRAYTKGDIAGFDEPTAKKLVEGGVVEYHSTGKSGRQQKTVVQTSVSKAQSSVEEPATSSPGVGVDSTAAAGSDNYRP